MKKSERDKLIDKDNRQKLTMEEVKYRTKKLHEHIEILTDEYVNDKARFPVRCNKCGLVFETTFNNLRQGNGCADCANNKRKLSQEEFERRLNRVSPWFEPIEQYKGVHTKIHVRCRDCGYIHSARPVNLFKGQQCKACRKREREEFLREHENKNKKSNK